MFSALGMMIRMANLSPLLNNYSSKHILLFTLWTYVLHLIFKFILMMVEYRDPIFLIFKDTPPQAQIFLEHATSSWLES